MNEKKIALYARVSTGDQDLEVQLHALREHADKLGRGWVEYTDETSGRKVSRDGLDEMLAACRRREVDAVVVVRLDRLARSLSHMAALGDELRDLKVDLVSLTEGIDTSSPSGRALFGMCGVFAQLEADLIRERTKAGVRAARRRGKRLGRPPKIGPEERKRAQRLRASGHSTRSIAKLLEVGQATVRRALGPMG